MADGLCTCSVARHGQGVRCDGACTSCRRRFAAGCPGPCNEEWREAQCRYLQDLRDYDPLDQEQSRPEPPDRPCVQGSPWCGDCRFAIREQLGNLDYLAALRALAELGADGYPAASGGQRVSGSADAASPSPEADDVDDTARMLAGWEQAYRDLNGWPSAIRHGGLAHQRTECISWLAERLDGVLKSDAAEDFGKEIMEWHADLKARAKAGVRTLAKPLRCPSCRLLLMKYTDGDKDVRCYNPSCRRILSLADYYAQVEAMAAQLKAAKVTRDDVRGEAVTAGV